MMDLPRNVNWSMGLFSSIYANNEKVEFLMAMWDLYLHRIKSCSLSHARWGTITTRFQDCTILESLKHVAVSTGIRWLDIAPWCIFKQAADELKTIFLLKDQLSDPFGYLPYIRCLNISHKSPYSASANPNLHYFCKMVGVLQGKDVGINAIVVEGAVEQDALTMAILFCVAKGFMSKADLSFFQTQEDMEDYDARVASLAECDDISLRHADISKEDGDSFPESGAPTDWCLWLKAKGGKFPASIKTLIAAKQDGGIAKRKWCWKSLCERNKSCKLEPSEERGGNMQETYKGM